MNSKGFTLVELLLTIAILGLLIAIAVPGYNKISDAIRKNQRNNKIDMIEVAASKYAYDTGETIIFVDKLVTEGYIDSDDEEGNIEDPLNNNRLNCYIVEMNKENDYYSAKFIDEKNYDNNGVCDLNKLQETSEHVNIEVTSTENSSSTEWLKGAISLKAVSNTISINCELNKCEWFSSSGANVIGDDEIILDNVNGLLETRYTFQYTIYDNESSQIKRFKSVEELKIDNDSPTIYQDQITVSDRFIYTNSKDVTIIASDGKGSGIAGYYLGLDSDNCNSTTIDSKYQMSNKFSVSVEGTYLLCVKDKVGNVSASSLKISYIS